MQYPLHEVISQVNAIEGRVALRNLAMRLSAVLILVNRIGGEDT